MFSALELLFILFFILIILIYKSENIVNKLWTVIYDFMLINEIPGVIGEKRIL